MEAERMTMTEALATNLKEKLLRDEIIDIIYSGDWQIRGWMNSRDSDITEHYMIDEDEVADAIIRAVREAGRR